MTVEPPARQDAEPIRLLSGAAWADGLLRVLDSPSLMLPGVLIAINFFATVLIALGPFGRYPCSNDEHVYLFTAETFSTGRLTVASPRLPEFFRTPAISLEDRAYGKYPPGWPLLLTPGVIAGVPWIINPILGAATLAVLWRIAFLTFGTRVSNLLLVMALVNPFMLLNGASYFSHPAGLFFISLFLLACVHCTRRPEDRSAWLLLGFSAGIAFLIRPFTAALFLGGAGARILASLEWRRPLGIGLTTAAVPFLACFFIFLAYNQHLTGSPWIQPFQKHDPGDRPEWIHGARAWADRVRSHGLGRLVSLGWWLPASPVLLVLGASTRSIRSQPLIGIGVAGFLAGFAGYFFYRYDGWFQYGPRYLYESLAPLLIVGAAVVARSGRLAPILAAGVVALNAWVLADETPRFASISRHRQEVARLAEDAGLRRAIIFMSTSPEHATIEDCARNGIGFDNPVLFVRDLGRRNRDLMDMYPDRAAYVYETNSETGRRVLVPLLEGRSP